MDAAGHGQRLAVHEADRDAASKEERREDDQQRCERSHDDLRRGTTTVRLVAHVLARNASRWSATFSAIGGSNTSPMKTRSRKSV